MRVVQIYGISFCGSTMLDLMLGNHEGHLSCGEIHALFRQGKPHHAQDQGEFWESIRRLQPEHIYKKLLMKGFDVVVDSSKAQYWLTPRATEAEQEGIRVEKIVMFKKPGQWIYSNLKRGNDVAFSRYITRYLYALKNLPHATYLEYETLAKNPGKTLQKLCSKIGVPYIRKMEEYWKSENTQLFGNTRARKGNSINFKEEEMITDYKNKAVDFVYSWMKEKEASWI